MYDFLLSLSPVIKLCFAIFVVLPAGVGVAREINAPVRGEGVFSPYRQTTRRVED